MWKNKFVLPHLSITNKELIPDDHQVFIDML